MNYMPYEGNLLSILSFASTRASWVSVSSCAHKAHIEYSLAWFYLNEDCFGQVADFYRYDYRVKRREKTLYISAVNRGYV